MKRIIVNGLFAFVFGLCSPQMGQAQGTTTFLSNLGQTSTGSFAVGSDSWGATAFFTGANPGGYFLNSIQLPMADASGSPSGFTVMVYTLSNLPLGGLFPGSSLGTLSGSANPATSGIYTYTAPADLVLSPSTLYFIVLTGGTAVATGADEWSYTGANSYNPAGGWSILGGGIEQSSNGSSWVGETPAYAQYAITASDAPEPGILGLFAVGGLLLRFQFRASHEKNNR